jgi:hypothetical protein
LSKTILAVASDRYPYDLKKAQAFRERHPFVLWVSIRTGLRVCLNQVDLIANAISSLAKGRHSIGVIFDGFTFGIGAPRNDTVVTNEIKIIEEIMDKVVGNVEAMYLNGNELPLSFLWSTAADFYIANHGTIQHKIGWFADAPGIVHAPWIGQDLLQNTPAVFAKESSVIPEYIYGDPSVDNRHGERADRQDYAVNSQEICSIIEEKVKSLPTRAPLNNDCSEKSLKFVNSVPTSQELEKLLQQAAGEWSKGAKEEALKTYTSALEKDLTNLRASKATIMFLLLNYLSQTIDNSDGQLYHGYRFLIAEHPSNAFLFERFVMAALAGLEPAEAYKDIYRFAPTFHDDPDLFDRIKINVMKSHAVPYSKKEQYVQVLSDIYEGLQKA